MVLVLAACADDVPELSFELDCNEYASETAALVEDFQAHLSPDDAVMAIDTLRLPAGEWHELDDSRWVYVNEQGDTVARTTIEPVTRNAVETFPETRYLTGEFEYCT